MIYNANIYQTDIRRKNVFLMLVEYLLGNLYVNFAPNIRDCWGAGDAFSIVIGVAVAQGVERFIH